MVNGIFSYFHTRKPTNEEKISCDKILITTDSTSWDPYSEHFSINKESILDYDGNITEQRYRRSETFDEMAIISVTVSQIEKRNR